MIAVTVVIPARDAAATIAETLASLLDQTYPHWQAIVVDDGSIDDTFPLASRLALEDHRIRVVRQEAAGVSAARNHGIALAEHDWLLFLDADDWLLPNALQRLVARVYETANLDLVYAGFHWVANGGVRIPRKQVYQDSDLFPVLTRSCLFAIHTCLVRRSVVLAVGGFDTGLRTCEDWDLWQRIARTRARIGFVQDNLALYRVRAESASLDGRRGLADGLEVIARGHRADPRVTEPASEYAAGEPADRRASASLMFVAWMAGFELGRGRDPTPLLDQVAGMRDPDLNPDDLKWSLLYSVLLPSGRNLSDWPAFWPEIETNLRRFLAAFEAHCGARDLAGRCERGLLDLILQDTRDRPITLGPVHVIEVEVTDPLPDVATADGVDRVRIDVLLRGRKLGSLDLPSFGGEVRSDTIADAIACDFGWSILGEFLQKSPEAMAQAGWTLFLQELFGEPGLTADQFYAAGENGAANETTISDQRGWVEIELADDIPSILAANDELRVVPMLAGLPLGAYLIRGGARRISATELRAAIILECGMELLVASVREAILGHPLDAATLRTRLAQAAAMRKAEGDDTGVRVGRRELGGIDSIGSRRAALPASYWEEIVAATRSLGETVHVVQPVVRCRYAPELVEPDRMRNSEQSGAANIQTDGRDYGRGHFEQLFAASPDPWDYDNDYERVKYEQTLSLVPQETGAALELACAEGHFTERLAPKVGSLLAADFSKVALERARRRCEAQPNVAFVPIDILADELPGKFDLIVCSEVLYYMGGLGDLARVANKLAAALNPGGSIVHAHANVLADEPDKPGFAWAMAYGAKAIADAFAAVPGLRLAQEVLTPLYRVQRFSNATPVQPEAPVSKIAGMGRLPARVAEYAREAGGTPPAPPSFHSLTEQLPILAYHRIASAGSQALAPYRVSPDMFEEQLHYLRDAGYRSVGLAEWREAKVRHQPLPGRCVMFTFDDGTRDFAEFAWPLLRRYGFGATLFVVAGEVGGRNRWDEAYGEDIPLLDWSELRELRAEGLEIGAHSFAHRHMTAMAPAEIAIDAMRARRTLLEQLGHPIPAFAYPYGDHDRVVRHLVGAAGFTFGLTCEEGHTTVWDDPMRLKRLTVLGDDEFATFVRKLGA